MSQLRGASGSVIVSHGFQWNVADVQQTQSPAGVFIGATRKLGRQIKWVPAAWVDTIDQSRLAEPPVVHQAAVRTVRLAHNVRELAETVFVDMNVGGKDLDP